MSLCGHSIRRREENTETRKQVLRAGVGVGGVDVLRMSMVIILRTCSHARTHSRTHTHTAVAVQVVAVHSNKQSRGDSVFAIVLVFFAYIKIARPN